MREHSQNSLIGRERELAALDVALGDALSGRGRLVLLSGEPGIGKTRLADEFSMRAAARGACVLWGRCWEGGGAPAYWPILQVVRALISRRELASAVSSLTSDKLARIASIVPELRQLSGVQISEQPAAPASDPEKARFELFDSVASLLRASAAVTALVLVVDDLHDADQSSLQMLTFVARGLSDSRAMIVGTHRDAEVRRSPELGRRIGELHHEGSTLPLGGLSRLEVAEFVESRSGRAAGEDVVERVYSATDGNPLFVDGVVRLMLAGNASNNTADREAGFKLPHGVRESIRRQLSALPGDAGALLKVASVIGNEFDANLVATIGGVQADGLAELIEHAIAAGVVSENASGSGRYRFCHGLIRSAVYDDLSASERSRLHLRIASSLEQLHASDLKPHLAALAHHFAEGGKTEKAIDYLIQAGTAAATVYAYEEAISDFERALSRVHPGDQNYRRSADLHTYLSNLVDMFDLQRAAAHKEVAIKLYEKDGDLERAADLRSELGIMFTVQRPFQDLPRARMHLLEALPRMELRTHKGGVAVCLNGLSTIARSRFRMREALDQMRRALELAEKERFWEVWCVSGAQYGSDLSHAGRLKEAASIAARVWEKLPVVDAIGWKLRDCLGGALVWGGDQFVLLGDLPVALEWWQRGLIGSVLDSSQRRTAIHNVGYALSLKGDLVGARQRFAEIGEAISYWCRGEFANSRNSGLAWIETSKDTVVGELVFRHFDYSRVARVLGENRQECVVLERFLRRFPSDEPYQLVEMRNRPELALHYVALGELKSAAEHLSRCNQILAVGEDWRALAGHVAFASAAYAAIEGNIDKACDQFSKAIEIYRRYSQAWLEADALHYWGRALLNAEENDRAIEKFDASIDIYRRIGAGQSWIDRVNEARRRPKVPATVLRQEPAAADTACTFHREGDFWTISHRDRTFRLKDMKGLHYIAHLLAHPGEQFHVHDLTMIVDGAKDAPGATSPAPDLRIANDLGDAGPVLDARAKAEYRKRRDELRAELEEAERANDIGRTDHVRAELEMLEDQLSAAVGVGGRDRKASVHAERARMRIGKAIRVSLSAIRENDPALGHHFAGCIRTGFLCGYTPELDRSLRWQL